MEDLKILFYFVNWLYNINSLKILLFLNGLKNIRYKLFFPLKIKLGIPITFVPL